MGSKSFLHKEIEPKILGDCGKFVLMGERVHKSEYLICYWTGR